jgi:hypothetical protein
LRCQSKKFEASALPLVDSREGMPAAKFWHLQFEGIT